MATFSRLHLLKTTAIIISVRYSILSEIMTPVEEIKLI